MEKSKIILLLLVVCIFARANGAEYVHLIPTDDAFVSAANGGTSYGGSTNLYVGDRAAFEGTCVSYLKWDLGEIPAGSTITHAEVWLNIHETYPSYLKKTVGAHNVTDTTWSEGAITWDTQPGYNLSLIHI